MHLLMKRIYLTALAFAAVTAGAQTDIKATKTAIEQWAKTNRIISEEKAEWEADKESIQMTLELYRDQIKNLEAKIETLQASTTSDDEKKRSLNVAIAKQKQINAITTERVAGIETAVLALAEKFPSKLQSDLSQTLDTIPRDPESANQQAGVRLRNAIYILQEADKFDSNIQETSETLVDGSEKFQVTVLYWGLSLGFYVDDARTRGGVIKLTPDGWQKQENNKMAPTIGRLIDVYRQTTDPEFVTIPITIE